jgi:hypothetical protein
MVIPAVTTAALLPVLSMLNVVFSKLSLSSESASARRGKATETSCLIIKAALNWTLAYFALML